MRDELNRNSYGDLVHKQYEKMDPLDPMTDIPEDDLKNVGTYTRQSLSSEDADHSGFSQDEAGPANAQNGDGLNPDTSALEAWRATGAERDNRTLGEESAVNDEPLRQSNSPVSEDAPLQDVPDADEIQAGSPVDPATPSGIDQHGIDLLNGVGGVDDETGRMLPEDF